LASTSDPADPHRPGQHRADPYWADLHWLDGVPAAPAEAAWGVPWPRGQVREGTPFALTTSSGRPVPVQTWPLAWWPDGSLKWTGHAAGPDAALAARLRLAPGAPALPAVPVTVRRRPGPGDEAPGDEVPRDADAGDEATGETAAEVTGGRDIIIGNGVIEVTVAASGTVLIPRISRDGRVTAADGRLVLLLQDRHDADAEEGAGARRTRWAGRIERAVIEQSGPVRAVVRLSGSYVRDGAGQAADGGGNGAGQAADGGGNSGNGSGNGSREDDGARALLPWTVRVYLSAGAESVRLVHSFTWDGDPAADVIRGMGLRIRVPLSDAPHDRHVRFAGDGGGIWGEPVRVLTGLRRPCGEDVASAQFAGTATPPPERWPAPLRSGYRELPLWNDFTLAQHSPGRFSVWKRTSPSHCWLRHAGSGERAPGLGYAGGASGGLGFGMRDFWQQFPRALDVRDAAGSAATVTMWSWSPHAAPMDLRPYDQGGHGLELAYEDGRPGFGEARGVSRSAEFRLWAFPGTPSRERLAALAAALADQPQLVAGPRTYHRAGVFGRWSLPDRSTPARAALEDSIAATVAFYDSQVRERQWYGFWDFGDVMHTYDESRHCWRYDAGGFAWDNAELGTDAMLWYQFLRTGDPVTFRLARAMTRHVSEADTHADGPFAGLGSRHNVAHWGCGAAEARVGESFTRRFLYYLTADELTGDLMRASLRADATLAAYPPLRGSLAAPPGVPAVIRIGPDWYALVSNWLTEWERTGDPRWRDRIVTGMRDIAALPAGLFTGELGGAVGFDPRTGHIRGLGSDGARGGNNLSMAFCGDQIIWEALDVTDVPGFRQALLDFARYVQADPGEQRARYGAPLTPRVFKTIYSRVTAWAGEQLGDAGLRRQGWRELLTDPAGQPWPAPVSVSGPAVACPVTEIPVRQIASGVLATNDAAQRCLAIIELLDIAPGEAP
jgi:hypothetical protein